MKAMISKKAMLVAMMLWLVTVGAAAQKITVTGVVTDGTDGSPLVGCNVLGKDVAGLGTVTGIDGKYKIRIEKGKKLVFNFIGFNTQEVTVKDSVINVKMQPAQELLEEVIVVGYGVQAKQRLTGAVLMVNDMRTGNTEEYAFEAENRFRTVEKDPLSTFSIDVDAASYGNMRRFINQGKTPPTESIRTEELINYFSYNYAKPSGEDPVRISTEVGACPWNEQHRLVKIGLKAREIADEKLPASNLVFLIDVSGSMYGPTRLELVKSSLKLLINNLRETDRVAIVVYSGSAGEVLPSTSGSDKQKIREALDNLTAGGSTAGGEGIKLAYKTARKNFIEGGNNRVILCSDGDFNVGVSSATELEQLIEKERKSGVFLTVLGYGMGNYKDNRMQVLAEKGNGNHAYIDNMQEAGKVLVQEFGGTLHTVAKDVKLQVEFNPAQVQAYRLIGYESRLLANEDFNDDTKDAGEMGAGHTVTALYEVIPVGIESSQAGKVDELKYQKSEKKSPRIINNSRELLTIKLRYKEPQGSISKKMEVAVTDDKNNKTTADFRFAAAVAMFGQLLRNSDFKGNATYNKVIKLAKTGLDDDEQGYRREFVRLVEAMQGIEE